ncbi:CBS domain-containing protein [Calidifontibacillus erzurumensis]|uniref:CBS domain-containing protein n=1 Tax=Calidifontibacillus erzurumensis TaxID=2741433 RepID=A0A8J8GBI0_9BACI|nr:CBS domain-containing protein [Calidifontibacillus erzurumensis]NSL50749.1 CBS domain-containing protein [Calidifontibacillus erzurumensis]
MKTVRDIMSTNVEYCTPQDNAYEVASKMKDLNVGAIPIVENGQLIGMITDRDLVVRGIAEKRSGSNAVTNLMTDELVTISPSATVEEAARLMAEKQIRRLPVVENGQLVGIVSLGDLAIEEESDQKAGYALSEISEPPELHS